MLFVLSANITFTRKTWLLAHLELQNSLLPSSVLDLLKRSHRIWSSTGRESFVSLPTSPGLSMHPVFGECHCLSVTGTCPSCQQEQLNSCENNDMTWRAVIRGDKHPRALSSVPGSAPAREPGPGRAGSSWESCPPGTGLCFPSLPASLRSLHKHEVARQLGSAFILNPRKQPGHFQAWCTCASSLSGPRPPWQKFPQLPCTFDFYNDRRWI